MIGVLLATAPYRTLCNKTIAELVGVKPYLVKKWVDALSSLLYQDGAVNRGIHMQHLSIYDFFVSNRCNYQGRTICAFLQTMAISTCQCWEF